MTLPDSVSKPLLRACPDFQVLAAFKADISIYGRFECTWIAAGVNGVALVREGDVELLPRENLNSLETHPFVSGGRLTVRHDGSTRLLTCYSNARRTDAEAFVHIANRTLDTSEGSLDGSTTREIKQLASRPNAESDTENFVLWRFFDLLPESKWWRLPVIGLALIASAAAAVLSPLLAGQFLFDEVLAPEGRFAGLLLGAIGLILLARLAEVVFSITWGLTNASLIHDLEIVLKRTGFASLQRVSMRFLTGRHTGELMARLEQDASDVALLFHILAPSAIHGGVFLLGSLATMLWLDWQLAMVAVVPFPVLFFVFRRIVPEINSFYERMFRSEAEIRTVTSDSLMGIRVVRAFGQEPRELKRFAGINRAAAQHGYRADVIVGTTRPPMELVTELVLVGVWAAGTWLIAHGQVTVGLLISFTLYLGRFFGPVGGLVELAQDWSRVSTAAHRMLKLIDSPPSMPSPHRPLRIGTRQAGLALEQVSFSYNPGQLALRNLSLVAEPGEMIGLVGPTGAGKSTVLNLLARLYDADEGVVRLGGINIRDISNSDLGSRIGVVLQETYLFRDSVAANIAYACPEVTEEQIVAAAVAAQAHEFIVRLPDGYNTELGPGGYGLSGGQRQRLAIARALLLDPPILLMDEATASVDAQTEQHIQKAIERVAYGRTVVVIAHRLSTLRMASRLYVLDDGRNVESGTHDQLMQNGGFYQRLVERQRKALHLIGVGE